MDAGNEGDWTNGQLIRVGVIDLWLLALIGIIGIGIIAGIICGILFAPVHAEGGVTFTFPKPMNTCLFSEILAGLWSGKPFKYSGKHYQVKCN
jgi:hypothetical protein